MTTKDNPVIPFQVQYLIDGMNNKNENQHTRANYRVTLETIKRALEVELIKFDNEMGNFVPAKTKRRKP
jgi:hypothetical protein